MCDEPQQHKEGRRNIAILAGKDPPLGCGGQPGSPQRLDYTEDAVIGSDQDGARPTLCQRVHLTNHSCSFLVEDGFAFLLGDIKGTPAEITKQRRFAWVMMPPGRAPPLKNLH